MFTAVEWVRTSGSSDARAARRVVASFGLAFGVSLAGALITVSHVAHDYIHQLNDEFRRGLAGLFAAVAAAAVLVVVQRLRPTLAGRVVRSRLLGAIVVVAAAVGFIWAYWLRPQPDSALPAAISPRPRSVGRAINDWHWSYVLHWFSSYWGFVGLVGVVVGLGLLAERARRGNHAAVAVVVIVIPIALLYVARPSIAPDQPWAMRRFLPVVIPGAAIALATLFATLWAARSACTRVARVDSRARGYLPSSSSSSFRVHPRPVRSSMRVCNTADSRPSTTSVVRSATTPRCSCTDSSTSISSCRKRCAGSAGFRLRSRCR